MKYLALISFTFFVLKVYAQDNAAADAYQQQADSLSYVNKYAEAAGFYLKQVEASSMIPFKKNAVINAGYDYARANKPDSAMYCFRIAVNDYGFRNLQWMSTEPVLADMRKISEFGNLKKYLENQNEREHNPENAKIIVSDIDLFWQVYDRYLRDTTNADELFRTQYFEKGSLGLQEYYRLKTPNIGGLSGFTHNMASMKLFYAGIRENTLHTVYLKDTLRIIFRNLKKWYPGSIFPNTTFVIGGWSSGGTSTDYGSIVGADIYSADEHTNTGELNLWQKNNLKYFEGMKYVVAHELVHIQQGNMADDTTLVSYCVKEGMADFIGELISGRNPNDRLNVWTTGKEYKVWQDFKKEMFLNRYSNWIANSKQETADHPADLGYWVGYQICKAYYDKSPDKKQAIYAMLNIRDYKQFYDESGIEEIMNSKKK